MRTVTWGGRVRSGICRIALHGPAQGRRGPEQRYPVKERSGDLPRRVARCEDLGVRMRCAGQRMLGMLRPAPDIYRK